MAEVFLRRLTRWQAETQRESVADLYAAAHRDPVSGQAPGREDFLRRFAEHDVQRPGFEMVIGSDPALAGCCYGYPLDSADDRHRELTGELPDALREQGTVGGLFLVAELLVLPVHRRTRVATRLQETLLMRSSAARAVVLLGSDNAPARAAFRSWGWDPVERPGQPAEAVGREVWSRALR